MQPKWLLPMPYLPGRNRQQERDNRDCFYSRNATVRNVAFFFAVYPESKVKRAKLTLRNLFPLEWK
jgi:hypothetical protein